MSDVISAELNVCKNKYTVKLRGEVCGCYKKFFTALVSDRDSHLVKLRAYHDVLERSYKEIDEELVDTKLKPLRWEKTGLLESESVELAESVIEDNFVEGKDQLGPLKAEFSKQEDSLQEIKGLYKANLKSLELAGKCGKIVSEFRRRR